MKTVLALLLAASATEAFVASGAASRASALAAKKGFGADKFKSGGATKVKPKSATKIERERASAAYEEAKASGVPDYRVYVAAGGSEDWAPVGCVTVPRTEKVEQSIYGNLDSLKSAVFSAYPGLKAEEDTLRFGYNLAVFPDDPVKLAKPEVAAETTNPFKKFAKDLTNPMNTK